MQHSCTDTELLLPIQKLDRQRILSTVDNLKPRGDTPLVYSVRQTPADLKAVGGGSVIVITDGQETCHGDPAKAADELKAAGTPVTLNIVGFTLKGKEKEDVERLMRPFAEATGGHYYYAENGEALARALMIAATEKFPFVVLDASGKQVAKGEAGDPAEELPQGQYKVIVTAADQQLAQQVTVGQGSDIILRVILKGDRFAIQ
jgi:Ca-activated chloride channel family protein